MSGSAGDDCVALPPHPGGFVESDLGLGLGVVLACCAYGRSMRRRDPSVFVLSCS